MKSPSLTAVAGALLGAVVGYLVFGWLARSFGAYGFAIPGVLVGVGAAFRYGIPLWVSFFSGCLGWFAGTVTTWKFLPFLADPSLVYFLRHWHQLPLFQQLLLVLGTLVAFWLPFRRRRQKSNRQGPSAA